MKKLFLTLLLPVIPLSPLTLSAQENVQILSESPGTAQITPKSAHETLREIKLANEAMLEAQKAMILRLDELEKQAQQLRIYSKRG